MADDDMDEDLDDEENDVDDQSEQDNEEDEAQTEQEQAQQTRANKKSIENRLKKLEQDIHNRFFPILTPNEKKVLEQGKKMKLTLATRVDAYIKLQIANKTRDVSLAGGSAGIGLLPIVLIVLVVIMALAAISAIFTQRWGDDGKPAPAEYALSGEQLYAARVFYTDENASSNKLVNDYAGYISAAIGKYNETNDEFTLNVTLPEEAFDFSAFLTEYSNKNYTYYNLAQLSFEFAKTIDAEYGQNKAGTNFVDVVEDIQYFGIEQQLFETAFNNVANTIINNSWYSVKEGNSNPSISTNLLAESLLNYVQFTQSGLTPKIFVQDLPVEGKQKLPWLNAGVTDDTPTKKFLAIMYFPRTNFTIGDLSYSVIQTGDGSIVVHYGERSFTLQANKFENDNYTYDLSGANINVGQVGQPILLQGEGTLSELYAKIKQQDEQSLATYFAGEEQNGKMVYNYNLFNLYAELNFDDYFSFADQNNINS